MKLFKNILTLAVIVKSTHALVNCDSAIERDGATPTICFHFDGNDADPYIQWYNDNALDDKYTGMAYIPGADPNHPEHGAAVHWSVDSEYVYLAVAVRATGWLGFGIGEAGGMLGADMVIFEAANPDKLIDAYTTDVRIPKIDDCESNWELLSSQIDEVGGFMMIEFKRLLDTGDSQDKAIFHDASTLTSPHRVIAAWGDDATFAYHGLNRARGAIRFFGVGDEQGTFDLVMEQEAEGNFYISSQDHEIAAQNTEYAETCFTREDIIGQGVANSTDLLNIVGFEPLIQAGNEAYVHHFVIYGAEHNDCENGDYMEVVYVWAPGDGPVSLPLNLGAPLFGDDGFQSFMIEVHYNNPAHTTGIIDNSGIRVYWTSEQREEQIGILQVGDISVELEGQPVGDGLAYHSFDCPGTCSSQVGQQVTVVREYLHMHETGARITNEQIRDGEVIRTASVEYWDFEQNGNAAVQQNTFDILPGDGFRTSCYFNGNGRNFGLGSEEEMCMAFLYYYPRQHIYIAEWDFNFPWMCAYQLGYPPCETGYEHELLSSPEDLHRTFGVPNSDQCGTDAPNPTAPTPAPVVQSAPTNAPNSGGTTVGVSMLALLSLFLTF